MPPVRTQVSCPNCRMPVTVALEQLFDLAQDPGAKQRFIGGRFNLIQCPNCRYQGQVATLLLYHDPDKELLLHFAPMELGLPQAEQEKIIGRLMNEVINKLPQEKRKGYLLNPKAAFTLQGMIERVLEGEGVTREMLDAQKAKTQLVQTFLATPDEQLPELVKQHDADIDAVFFQLLNASAEATAAGGSQAGAQRLLSLQARLLELSSFGAQARRRQQSIEAAVRELQALGDRLTPDKLLELVMKTDDEDKLAAYVSYVRPAMDYAFFEALTRRLDRAKDKEKDRLTKLRETLLQLTQEVDQSTQAQMSEAAALLRALLEAPDPSRAVRDNLPQIDDVFLAVLNMNIEAAQRAGRQDMLQRLSQINEAITRLVQEAAPPEVRFINELLALESDEAAEAALKGRAAEINQELVDTMSYIGESLRRNRQTPLADRVDKLRDIALGELMAANWKM